VDVELSKQELLDVDDWVFCCNWRQKQGFDYVLKYGVMLEESYPYLNDISSEESFIDMVSFFFEG
jgi:hypothetical protein